jgi:4'-phosphopantetheinyl transferase EntD
MRDLLPPQVAVSVARPEDWLASLLPAELPGLGRRPAPARIREYAAGRACARRALVALGHPPDPIPSAPDRAPVWPAGITGSITHTASYCAAATARTRDVLCLGIDAEPRARLERDMVELICTPAERQWCARRADPGWPVVIFSVKEAVYKAWAPLTRQWLDFDEVEVELDPGQGTFAAAVSASRLSRLPPVAPALDSVRGRFAVDEDMVRAAAVIPRAGGHLALRATRREQPT